jgi:hypothetical protein
MNPVVRTIITHVGTASGTALAVALAVASQPQVVYEVVNQVNVVVVEVTKLVALVTPLATLAFGAWKATTKSKIQDLEQDKRVQGVVAPAFAVELGPKVVATAAEVPLLQRDPELEKIINRDVSPFS